MKVLSVLKSIAFSTLLLVFFSCDNSEMKSSDNSSHLTFENIEKGTSIADARAQLTLQFEEHQVGQQPNLVVFALEDGRQLVFTDGELTDKNKAEKLEQVVGESGVKKSE